MHLALCSHVLEIDGLVQLPQFLQKTSHIQFQPKQHHVVVDSVFVGTNLLAKYRTGFGLILFLANFQILFQGVVAIIGCVSDDLDDRVRFELAG